MSLIKVKDGKEYGVFPLEIQKAQLGQETVYDRETRGKSWVIIDLALSGPFGFIPKESRGLITADGKKLFSASRR